MNDLTWEKHLTRSHHSWNLKLHTLYKTIHIIRHFLNTFFFFSIVYLWICFLFHSKWHSSAMIPKSRRAGRLATSKAECILALEVQLGGQSCVGAENAYRGRGNGGVAGWTQPLRRWDGVGSLKRGLRGYTYDDFSFLALGESAPWEFTPFTPLAKRNAMTHPI